jgi:hypothetical protein
MGKKSRNAGKKKTKIQEEKIATELTEEEQEMLKYINEAVNKIKPGGVLAGRELRVNLSKADRLKQIGVGAGGLGGMNRTRIKKLMDGYKLHKALFRGEVL